ncbi:MAG: hypothetical protein ACOX3G_11270 [Armatimonadota bacterium]
MRSITVHKIAMLLIAAAFLMTAAGPCCVWAANGTELGAVDAIGSVTDVIVGRNTKGPYSLSWTNFSADDISVVINGRTLKKGSDYNIDIAKGIVSFNSVLVNDAIVRVSYRTLPGKSQKATTGSSIPVTINLRSGQSGNLKMMGLYAQSDPKNPNAGKSVIGFGGDRAWKTGKMDSMMLLSHDDNNSDVSSMWERAAMKFGGDTNVGKLKLTGSYLHSGQSFAGGKEYGTDVGKDLMSFAAAFAASPKVQAAASFKSSEDTAGKNKGVKTVTNEQSVAYNPIDSTKLSLVHSTNEITSADGKRDNVESSGIHMTSTAFKRTTLRSSMTQRVSDSAGAENLFSAGVTTKPSDQVDLDINYANLENNAVGQQSSTDVKVSAKPSKQLAVQAGYSGVDSTVKGAATKTSVAVQATPRPNLQIKGSMTDSADGASQQYQRDLSLTSTPFEFAKLTAMYSQKGVNDLDDVVKGAELHLTPSKRAKLMAGYRYSENGPTTLTVQDYSAETKPWDFLRFVGNYRRRDLNTSYIADSGSLSMELTPSRLFALTGSYQANPEDKDGKIQQYYNTSVGLKTRIGSVGLETSFSQKDQYAMDLLSDERSLGMAMPVFGHGKLTTGCKLTRSMGVSSLGSRTYQLGYSHSIGSDFSLALNSYYTQYLQNKMVQPEKTEVSTELSLGAKF